MDKWRWEDNHPHKKFYDHLVAGGTIYRDDKLNDKQEFLTLADLGGEAIKIVGYGYNDLHIVPSAILRASFPADASGELQHAISALKQECPFGMEWAMKIIEDSLATRPAPSAEKALDCIPSNWLDPLLTGPDAVIHKSPAPEIEALLNAVRARIKALAHEAPKADL